MTSVVISSVRLVDFLEGGGHFWAYMQYAHGLRQVGCEVHWLESFKPSGSPERDRLVVAAFFDRMERHGLEGKIVLAVDDGSTWKERPIVGMTRRQAEDLFGNADLLLNFKYGIDADIVSLFRRTALVDIDPGILQYWMSRRAIIVPSHDCYFTIGDTVGGASARFADCGIQWIHIRPPVCLEAWPYAYDPAAECFTTVSSWWSPDWIGDSTNGYDNSKRISFLRFADLPRATSQPLELALFLADSDDHERRALEGRGWRVRHSLEVARTPEMYRSYVQSSRGEFSCAKPSCMNFQNAWISDRTLCYLASGKPVVVQNTGANSLLDDGEGVFRFTTMDDAAAALETINSDYERHCRAARSLAEDHFDAKQTARQILEAAL